MRNIFNRVLHKIAHFVPGGSTLRPLLHRLRGVKTGKNVWISQSVYIDELHPDAVTIHDNCTIGYRTAIFTHFYWGAKRSDANAGPVTIEKDVFIGPCCVILPNVRIGQGSVIKAGTVVTKDVPPHTFWGMPSAEALGRTTVPLTSKTSYHDFIAGLKPVRIRKKAAAMKPKSIETATIIPPTTDKAAEQRPNSAGTPGIPVNSERTLTAKGMHLFKSLMGGSREKIKN